MEPLRPEPVRLAKYFAAAHSLSRAQAEQYITGGHVRVNGVVIESPQHRVKADGSDLVELDNEAKLTTIVPMTILWHKPSGIAAQVMLDKAFQGITLESRASIDRSGIRLLKQHLKDLVCATPLETGASGLVVLTQDFPVKRKLIQDNAFIEHELIVDIAGDISADHLRALNRPNVKVAISKQTEKITGLRFAYKAYEAGTIAAQCDRMGLQIEAMKRLRVGRIALSGLEVGQWRFLMGYERF